jgi:hypothetical protein
MMEGTILIILGVILVAFLIMEVVFDIDTIAGRFIRKLTGNHPEKDTRDDEVNHKDEK